MSKYEKTTRKEIRDLLEKLPETADDDIKLWALNSASGPNDQVVFADKKMLGRCRTASGKVEGQGTNNGAKTGRNERFNKGTRKS